MTGWTPADGDKVCQDCGNRNVVWFTDNPLWNEVMPDDGIVCIPCFIARCHRADIVPRAWRLIPEWYRHD